MAHVHDRSSATTETCAEKSANDKKAIQDSARDMFILSLTDIQIMNENSGFAVFAGMSVMLLFTIVISFCLVVLVIGL